MSLYYCGHFYPASAKLCEHIHNGRVYAEPGCEDIYSNLKAYIFTEKGKIELRNIEAPTIDNASEEDRCSAILKPRYLSPCSSDVHTV